MKKILPGTSVIVPVFNNWHLTEQCLDTLLAGTAPELLADVIVVDNGSTDETGPGLAARTGVTWLRLTENRGFAAACNVGARLARGASLFFLNNDAFTAPSSVANVLRALDDPGVGVVGARLLYGDGTIQHAGMGLLESGDWWHLHVHLAGDLPDALRARDLPCVTGAAMLVRRSLFESLGGFDEGYRNGYEDVDLCMRAWQAGARVRYEPSAVFTHLESATSGRFAGEMDNRARFFARWQTALETQPRYPLGPLPALGVMGDLASPTPGSQAGRHIVRYARGMGLPVRWLLAEQPRALTPELESWTTETFAPSALIDWLEVASVTTQGGKRIAYVAPLDAAQAASLAGEPVDAFWCATDAGRDRMRAAGVAPERAVTLHCGADVLAFTPTAPAQAFDVPRPLILTYVSASTSDAAISRVLEAFVGLDGTPSFIVVSELERPILEARLGPQLQRLGPRVSGDRKVVMVSTSGGSEAIGAGFFTGIDAFVLAEPPEPTGFVLLAAMACAAPIVAVRHPEFAEFLNDRNALLTPANGLGVALRAALTDRAATTLRRERVQFDAVRRFPTTMSIRRGRELLRALHWGSADADTVEMTPERIAAFRAAAQEPLAVAPEGMRR